VNVSACGFKVMKNSLLKAYHNGEQIKYRKVGICNVVSSVHFCNSELV